MCLGGPRSNAGHHHVALIAANGDIIVEHASAQALREPLAPDDLSPQAFAAFEQVLASPPACCRFGPAAERPSPSPPRAPTEARPAWYFYPFPLQLPPGVHRTPPLSEVLATSEPTLPLQPGARQLALRTVRTPPPPPRIAGPRVPL